MDTKKLRQKILDLAIHGKLVPQDPNDEPASVLLERIREEKDRLIKEGKIKKSKSTTSSDTSHYENVPFKVPKGWCWCTVGDIVYDLKYGTSKKSSESGSVPVLRMGNLTRKGTISYDNLVYSSDSSDIEEYELTTGDLLFNRTNSSEWVGKTALYDGKVKSIYAGYLIRVRTIIINSEYLNIVMNSQYYRNWCYSVKTDAVNQSNINANKLASLLVPIPPISEQNQIVQEVTKMTEFIDLVEQGESDLQSIIDSARSKILDLAIHGKLVPQDANDEPASELLKRINPKAVASCDNPHYENVPFEIPSNWVWVKLGDIAQSNIGLTYKPADITQDGVPVMRSNNIQNGVICNDDIVRVNTKLLDNQVLNNGDLLICARNGSKKLVGKCALVNNLQETTSFGAFMAVCRSNMNNWLYHVLSSEYFKNYLDDSNSTTIHQVTQKMLLAFEVPLPPLREQECICTKIKELYNFIDDITDALS